MVGIVLTGKENYPEWSRMIKHTLIFNELWKGVCVEDGDNGPVQPTSDKELVIWENKNSKAYALIAASVNEEVSHHISSYSTDNVVEQQLDRLDRFAKTKSFQEFDNHIPHLKRGIPILDQTVESSSEEHSPPNETPTTDDALSDVIDRIGRLNLDSLPTQSTEQPGPSQKGPPKWLTKTLESVHPDEIGKTGTINANRQNGGDVDDSNSPIDMDVSYDCELNLSTDLNQLPLKKLLLMMKGKKQCKRNFDGDKEIGVSTSGYAMSLGSGAVSWRSRKQSVPVDSTTEAEYMAAAETTKEIVWLRKILEDLQEKQVQSTPLMIDNTSAIKLAKNPKFHD
eukprot:PITA_03682